MNPPFSNGDEHLLKALEMQKDGGSIICLLNAETIRNPYTNRRKALLQTLNEVSAQIEFLSDEFSHAERKTDVEIALIKIVIPRKEHKSDIYEHFQKAEEYKEERIDVTDVAVSDYLENIICLFNIECKAGIELIRQYNALQPYIKVSFNKDYNYGSLLALTTTKNKEAANVNSYLKDVRYKYWSELLTNEKFVGKLTSNLRKEYYNMVSNLKNYDFNAFNIGVILDDIQKNVNRGIEETIMGLFDKLTAQHSWYPECAKNIHLFNGWKTNKAHMINKKVILPTYGNFSSYSWDKDKFQLNNVYDTMIDIEKVLNYLDSDRTESIDMLTALKVANESGQTRNIRLKYFDIDLYKKGTTHIKFRDMELLKKFNIFAAQNRNWLPPNYGKVKYEDMTEEEKAVIDDFQGQKDYEETLRQSNFYLGVEKLLMIE